jgi:hypothetical protein
MNSKINTKSAPIQLSLPFAELSEIKRSDFHPATADKYIVSPSKKPVFSVIVHFFNVMNIIKRLCEATNH